jgi:WD40 repeat protein
VLVVDDSGRKVAQFDPNGDGPFAVTADGELAFTAHGNLNLWRLPAGQPLRSWRLSATNAPVAVAASADGAVAAALSSGGTITLFSGSASRSTTVPISSEGVPRLSISADGRLLAVTVPDGVRVFDTQTMRTVRTLAGTAFSFSSSGKLLAIQHPDLSVAVLHTAGWQPVTTLQGQPAVASVTFSPDDRLVATMGTDGVLRLADATDGTLLGTKQVIESSLVAQRTGSPPVVLTSRGFALVPGANGSGALAAYLVCDQCFNAGALLEQANERLSQIDPVTPAH